MAAHDKNTEFYFILWHAMLFIVVHTLNDHRHLVCGQRTGSNHSGVEEDLSKKNHTKPKAYTYELKQVVHQTT